MPKAYWVAHVDVKDPVAYERYRQANGPVFSQFGAKFLTRGGTNVVKEGALRARHVIIEFKDYATALACYESPAYQAAKALREPASHADLVIIDGYETPPAA